MKISKKKNLEGLFNLSISLKFIHGIFETIGGMVLLLVSTSEIKNLLGFVFRNEIAEDKGDLLVRFFFWLTNTPFTNLKTFAGIYLLFFGVVNTWLAYILLAKKIKHYKFVEIILGVFISYQIYQFFRTYSPLILFLATVDSIILYLIFKYHKSLLNE